MVARCVSRGDEEHQFRMAGGRYEPHNLSSHNNSNSLHSQSLNTCSSIASTAAISRYPLVVSFRKIPARPVVLPVAAVPSASYRLRTHTLDSTELMLRSSIKETYNPIYDDDNLPLYYRKLYFQDTATTATAVASNSRPQLFKHKRIYASPYASPEMSQDSIKLEQNLSEILQELTLSKFALEKTVTASDTISKSRSAPSFFQTG